MRQYLEKEVETGLAIMIRDKVCLHVFDYDKNGEYIFVMAVAPKGSIPEHLLTPSDPLDPKRAETPVRRETEKTS